MVVDVSHASMSTAMDAITVSRAPVIASHSSVRAVLDHARNLSDEVLLALKERDGVVQVVAYDSYLREAPEEKQAALEAVVGGDGPP